MMLHGEVLNTLFNLGARAMFKEEVAFRTESRSRRRALRHRTANGGGGNVGILGKKLLPEAANIISVCK